jgi:hypothetical protein
MITEPLPARRRGSNHPLPAYGRLLHLSTRGAIFKSTTLQPCPSETVDSPCETVSKLGKQRKKWYGEGGYCPWSPHPTLSQRERALSFRAVASPLSLREGLG